MNLLKEALTRKIIKAFYAVYNDLGSGFRENAYENAMMIELEEMGFYAQNQVPIKVYYKNKIVGDYFADLLIENFKTTLKN